MRTVRCFDLPARQQTLRDTVAWSYDLLDAAAQTLFRRLAVFVGGCTFEAAASVSLESKGEEVDALDGIAALVDNSLLRQDQIDEVNEIWENAVIDLTAEINRRLNKSEAV